jgi:hypothetical protein
MGIMSRIDRAALAAYCQSYGRWVKYEKIIEEKFESHYHKYGTHVNGLAYAGETECIIYARIPESDKDVNLLVFGHEVLHCFGMKHE